MIKKSYQDEYTFLQDSMSKYAYAFDKAPSSTFTLMHDTCSVPEKTKGVMTQEVSVVLRFLSQNQVCSSSKDSFSYAERRVGTK
jgi:hypothetical protein